MRKKNLAAANGMIKTKAWHEDDATFKLLLKKQRKNISGEGKMHGMRL